MHNFMFLKGRGAGVFVMSWNIDRSAVRLLNPKSWRVSTRRLFAITFPLSVPLWIAAILVVSLVQVSKLIAKPLLSFWNDEPTRISGGYYEYAPRRPKSGDVVRLKDEPPHRKRAA